MLQEKKSNHILHDTAINSFHSLDNRILALTKTQHNYTEGMEAVRVPMYGGRRELNPHLA